MSNKITVEIIPATQLEEGDILLRDGGDTVTVSEILIRGTNHVSFRDEDGGPLPFYASRDVFRVVPEQQEEPAEEEPVWPDADFIRIIRGTEDGDRIDGSLAFRINSLYRFSLLDGPKAGSCVLPSYDGDAIYEWEEVVPVAKSAILAGLDTPTEDDEPENDTDDVDGEETEDEDEDDCDGTCPFCTFMRLISSAATGKDKEDEE
jgi:hypothetical protein